MPQTEALHLEPYTVDIVIKSENAHNTREQIASMAGPTTRIEEREGKLVAIETYPMPPFLAGETWSWYGSRPDLVVNLYEEARAPRTIGEIEEEGEVIRLALRELRKEAERLETALAAVQGRLAQVAGDGGVLRNLHAEWLYRRQWDADGDRPPVVVEVSPGTYPNRQVRLDLIDPTQVIVDKVTKATITVRRRGDARRYDFKRSDGTNSFENARLVDPEKAVADYQAWGRVNRKAKK